MSVNPWIVGGVAVVGIGGFLLWRRSQKETAPTLCERLAAAAGSVAGVPITGSAATALCGAAGALEQVGSTIHQALGGKQQRGTCPEGTTLDLNFADHRGVTNPDEQELGGACRDGAGNIVGTIGINGFTPWTPTSQPPPPVRESEGTRTEITCTGGTPPAGFTWDVASSSWRRLRVGETANPGPCAQSAPTQPLPINTETILLRSAISPTLALAVKTR